MVAQHEAGMLLCLCSKNSEADVIEVFERRREMPLQWKHIVSWRINWQSKADNLKALAQELNLGLDSFIFIDDNPVECAEVQAKCPEVLTLQLPEQPEEIPQFLRHVWAFDRLKVTQEDKQRTELYQQNLQREQLRTSSLTLEAFLESLNLNVQITEPTPEQLARVAQLTQRTNQFNVTTLRRTESEIQQLCQSGQLTCRIVEVSDHFGDYGLVGVLLFTKAEQELSVDTFLLSCRTLGRGVEHRMLAHLGAIAIKRGCTHVVIPYHPTQKNEPALNFLQGVGVTYQRPDGEGFCFSFPAQIAAELTYQPRSEEPDIHQIPEKSEISGKYKKKTGSNYAKRLPFLRIATELNTPAKIFQLIDSKQQRTRKSHSAAYVTPQTPLERALAEIWKRAIGIDRVGIHDNFFDLGGNSFLALSLFAQIKERFGRDLPLTTLFQSPTIAQLSKLLERQDRSVDWSSLVAIQPNGSRQPFFFVHAAGGGLLKYQKLAAALGDDQPFYGLESLGMDGKQTIPTTIEEMAAHYIQEIRAFQPEGPYLMGGLCFGGLVAFEMAQQLKAQGQDIPLLLLFNTTAPGALRRLSFWERLWQHITNLLQLGPSYALKKLKGKLVNLTMKRQQKSRSSTHTKLRSNKLSGSPDAVTRGHGDAEMSVTSLTATPYQKMKVNPTTEGTASYKERYKPVAEIHRKAQQRYEPTVYPGKVTLFQTEGDRISPPGYYQDPHWGWRNLAGGGLEIHVIPGRHNAVLLEANIPMQAKTLRACLDQVQPEILDTMSLTGR
jgi:FkbH-like protein